jgi:hypothetical protein
MSHFVTVRMSLVVDFEFGAVTDEWTVGETRERALKEARERAASMLGANLGSGMVLVRPVHVHDEVTVRLGAKP